ncbi:SusC/RagA family TonB-linked outer membrane protein [Flavobacterium sp. NG2]|uniref:SusC/RagA family TonB-linked outer membrane protein n=1 Tax=Flavobacterium sp. NG2 TaxID=3097547 RepID=UPI002A8328D8|nr:SusC/RagA family TonB-linked outer membrane protein [Flavobacterium sp. NG2]WPR72132.1 SusC/RagA family TonB-linked outer membrane protein [Flavobacterium sp. NG2]
MNLKTKLILMLMMIFNISLFAQGGYILSGTVVDGGKMPIPGANVIIANSTKGASTDIDGKFRLEVKSGDVLQVSYIGFKMQSIKITNQKTLNIVLADSSNELEEIVVVGYGTRKKSHLTGAIAKIGGEDVAAVQASRVDEALAGKLSGVRIQAQDGAPGSDPKIQIRAASSVNGNSSPLIVVDGYPISGSIATINPNDIESLEVLKDAASAAIYGSRGANGVILVTTKKGKAGKPSFSYNAYSSVSNRYVKDNVQMTASEWGNKLESGIADGTYNVSGVNAGLLNYRINAFKNAPDVLAVEDWLFRTGKSISNDFSMSGGTEDVKYFASLGHQNIEGIVITQGFEKINARMNVDAKLGEKFKTGVSFNGFTSKRDIVGWDMRDLIRAYNISPIYHTAASIAFVQQLDAQRAALSTSGVPGLSSSFDSGYRAGPDSPFNKSIYTLQPGMTAQDWHYGRAGNGIGGTGDAGPATKLDNTDRYQKTYFANINTYLQYSLLEGLNLKTVLGADLNDVQDYYWRGLESDSQARSNQTNLDQTELKQSSVLSETTLSYTKEMGKHEISAVAGVEFQSIYYKGVSLAGTNVPFRDVIDYSLFDPADITVRERDETIIRKSVFGRVNYAYDDRYLASVSVRRDGDSRFGANKKYQTFPAVSLGWNVHKESFYKSDLLSLVKLRFSTGSLGTTSDLGAYNSLSLLRPQATVFGTGFLLPSDVANPDLTWQTNTETNFGVDFGITNNRFRLSVDYYTSDIQDILINQSVSEVLGTPSIRLNSGDVRSSGLEFELSAGLVQNNDFSWDVSANLSTVKTEIKDLGGLTELPRQIYGQSGRGPVFRNYVGGGIGEMWGIQTLGKVEDKYMNDPSLLIGMSSSAFYVKDQQSPGEPGYGVIDKTKTVAEGGDLVKIGQNTPDFYWGLNSSFKYKDFDMSFQLQGSHGAEVWNVDPIYWNSEFGGRLSTRFDAEYNAPEGTPGKGIAEHNGLPYLDSNNQLDAQIQDASYVALRNLTIGYSFKSELAAKVGVSSARVYAAATNLLYLMGKDYTSFNPEGVDTTNTGYAGPTTYGVQVGASPIVRSFTLGLNVNF